jgi:Fe-S cluster assembly iron-binding protein IscA
MNYAKTEDLNSKKDEVVTANDVTVLVDPKAIFYIAGTVMDFEVRFNSCPSK